MRAEGAGLRVRQVGDRALGVAAARVTLRPAGAGDDGFLRQLFAESRPELQHLPEEIVDLQIRAQRAHYHREHPQALDEIIELGNDPVGRCWTAESGDELRLLDLVVGAGRRGHGVGTAVLTVLAERSLAGGLTIRLAVWHTNVAARRLYESAGFVETGSDGGHVVMSLGSRKPR